MPYYGIKHKVTDVCIPLPFYDLVVSFANNPSAELLEYIRAAGGRELKVQRTTVFLITNPTSEQIRFLVDNGANRTCPCPVGALNISVLASVSLVRRIFSNFLLAHTYPAFIDPDHMKYNEEHWKVVVVNPKRKNAPSSETSDKQGSKRVRTSEGGSTSSQLVDYDMDSEPEDAPPSEKIRYAIPPATSVIGWGNPGQLPDGDGLFIRYVSETQGFDGESIVMDVIEEYFTGCLGSNGDAVKQAFDKMVGDFGIISKTELGKQFAHLAKCFDLGLKSQARIFPIFDNEEYVGSALMGAGFKISAYSSSYSPANQTTLREQIERAGSTTASLDAIASLADDYNAENILAGIRRCRSMMELRLKLADAALEQSHRDQILTHARGLRFKTKSLPVSPANLNMILSFINHPENIPADLPIHSSMLFETNLTHVVWSAFGELAPSCRFAGGPLIDLTTSKDLPKHIGFRQVPLKDALIDLDQTLSAKGYPGCTLNRRSGPFKDRIYTGLEATGIIQSLIAAAGVQASAKGKDKSKITLVVGGDSVFDDGF